MFSKNHFRRPIATAGTGITVQVARAMEAETCEILYATVSRGEMIIADAPARARREFRENVRGVLRLSYVFEKERRSLTFQTTERRGEMYMHYVRLDELVIMCVAPASCKVRVAHSFLNEVGVEFNAAQGPSSSLLHPDRAFDATLQRVLEWYTDPANDRAMAAQRHMDSVQSMAIETVTELLERGEAISALVERASDLDNSSQVFRRQAKAVEVKRKCVNWKLTCATVTLVIVLLIIALIAGAAVVLWKTNRLNAVVAWVRSTLRV